MSEEEETRAALVAAALAWPERGSPKPRHHYGYHRWNSGHIDLRSPFRSLCGVDPYSDTYAPLCPKCALAWYREVRDE